jgi:hypothetical protein
MNTQQKKAVIVGTAETWRKAPWADPSAHIVGLNDAMSLGFPRIDEWYDLHSFDHMFFRDPRTKIVYADQVPKGFFVRPAGHLETLQRMATTIPVWLQDDPPAGWVPTNAQRFPLADLEAKYGDYWASGPAYELLHLYDRGFRDIHIYGIHLATEHEYRLQRPNFEHLIGRLLGPQVSIAVKDGMRLYVGETGVSIGLPIECPILQHGWKYAFQPKPQMPVDPMDVEWKAIQKEKAKLVQALVNWPKGKDKSRQIERLRRIEIIEMDIQQCRQKRAMGGTLAVSLG